MKPSILCVCMAFICMANADEVKIQHKGLTLNGNLEVAGPKDTIFLIVHGTWGHHGMEIISGLQGLLADYEQNSLAISLSLGVNDRKGFMGCEQPIIANHGDAASEIAAWVDYLKSQWTQIVIVGHSRGGNQVSLFQQMYPSSKVSHLVLIAPMTRQVDKEHDAYDKRFSVPLNTLLDLAREESGGMINAGVINCEDIAVNAESFLSYYGEQPNRNTPELLNIINRPVLVFLGTEDSLSLGYKSQSAIVEQNPLVEEYWIEGADHFFRDFYSDELIEVMLQWLDK